MLSRLRDEIDSYMARDPAMRSRAEVIFCYPGFHALLFYKLAHAFWRRDWRLLGRFVSHLGRVLTGIEIHPGAIIGRRLFIDHGMGVVIGETAEVGDDVTLYQGVTLGGTSLVPGKRHPTLGNNVIVGSGAQILGPFAVGDGARIGANAVVLSPVPPGVTMVGIPAQIAAPRGRAEPPCPNFVAYGMPEGLSDPVNKAICGLLEEVHKLSARVESLEAELADREPADREPIRIRAVQ